MNYTHRASSHLWGEVTYLFNIHNSYKCMDENTGMLYKCHGGMWWDWWKGSSDVKIEELNIYSGE